MNPNLNKLLQAALDKHHIELNVCASQNEALRAMLKENFCLAVMDTSMIETDKAIQFISDFRLETYAPILVLSTGDIVMRILNAGADMCFSFSASSELIVFHALSALRRYTLYTLYDEKKPSDAVIHRGDLMIDPIRHLVTLDGEEIYLQPREFRLLLHFARNPGIVVTPDRIGETIWQNSYDHNRDVTAVIAELRRKLGDTKDHPTYIATVHGFGYKFLPQTRNLSKPVITTSNPL